MNYWNGAAPVPFFPAQPEGGLPDRGCLSKDEYSNLLREDHCVLPGTRAYMQKASEFMPLSVEIGREVETRAMAMGAAVPESQ